MPQVTLTWKSIFQYQQIKTNQLPWLSSQICKDKDKKKSSAARGCLLHKFLILRFISSNSNSRSAWCFPFIEIYIYTHMYLYHSKTNKQKVLIHPSYIQFIGYHSGKYKQQVNTFLDNARNGNIQLPWHTDSLSAVLEFHVCWKAERCT